MILKFITVLAWMVGPLMTGSIVAFFAGGYRIQELSKPFVFVAIAADTWLLVRYFG